MIQLNQSETKALSLISKLYNYDVQIDRDINRYKYVAAEYYDDKLHPTCANFRHLSKLFFKEKLTTYKNGNIIEVGAGKSVVAEILLENDIDISTLTITDLTEEMLGYSNVYMDFGASLSIEDATILQGIDDNTGDLICSSLGDPYNLLLFWETAHRVLKRNGRVLFTTPSYEWALKYRAVESKSGLDEAVFTLSDSSLVYVDSYVYPLPVLKKNIESAGLIVVDVVCYGINYLTQEKISFKIVNIAEGDKPIIVGLEISKP